MGIIIINDSNAPGRDPNRRLNTPTGDLFEIDKRITDYLQKIKSETSTASILKASEAVQAGLPQPPLDMTADIRAQVRESFGKVVMAMMALPRYRHQTLDDLQHLVLEPLIRDRVAIAHPTGTDRNALFDISGFAIWASVSETVDKKIREQVKAGVWPLRLQSDDWASGNINWLIDVIAPDAETTASVLGNFRQVVKEGDLRLHPIIGRLVDKAALEKMGARQGGLQ